MLKKALVLLVLGVVASGCATSFTGAPHVADGRAGCEAKCKEQGMSLAGMVFMGEYTSGCVCTLPGQTASAARQVVAAAEAGAAAGGTGVVLQMQREQQQQAARMNAHFPN